MIQNFIDALTPNAKTKAAYIGEFSFYHTITDSNGEEITQKITVPWTTIKEIMLAIHKQALYNHALEAIEQLKFIRRDGKLVDVSNLSDQEFLEMFRS